MSIIEATIKRHSVEYFPTLSDFANDGRLVLTEMVRRSPWGSLPQALASLSVFAHPDVVVALKCRAVFRTIRGGPKGSVSGNVMLDDNASPAPAFAWSTGFKRGRDVTCNHIYTASQDPASYSDVRNICYTPTFIAKLTDTQAKTIRDDHLSNLLRYRAFELYGYTGPVEDATPIMPKGYESLIWASPIGEGVQPLTLEDAFRRKMKRRPKDRLAKSARVIGWTYSDYEPDLSVQYSGED